MLFIRYRFVLFYKIYRKIKHELRVLLVCPRRVNIGNLGPYKYCTRSIRAFTLKQFAWSLLYYSTLTFWGGKKYCFSYSLIAFWSISTDKVNTYGVVYRLLKLDEFHCTISFLTLNGLLAECKSAVNTR